MGCDCPVGRCQCSPPPKRECDLTKDEKCNCPRPTKCDCPSGMCTCPDPEVEHCVDPAAFTYPSIMYYDPPDDPVDKCAPKKIPEKPKCNNAAMCGQGGTGCNAMCGQESGCKPVCPQSSSKCSKGKKCFECWSFAFENNGTNFCFGVALFLLVFIYFY